MGIHDGHRQRLKDRFMRYGLEGLEEHSILELLLFFGNARGDVNPTAHRLLDKFGSISGVVDATPEALREVDGVGENTVVLLKLIPQMSKYYLVEKQKKDVVISDTNAAGDYLLPRFLGESDEVVYMLTIDRQCRALSCRLMGRGGADSAVVSIRNIVEAAIADKAAGVILAHNHTSGIAMPSAEDREVTEKICRALDAVNIKLVDHLVVSGDDFVSMADSGMIN